jgi:hypothetical protein
VLSLGPIPEGVALECLDVILTHADQLLRKLLGAPGNHIHLLVAYAHLQLNIVLFLCVT